QRNGCGLGPLADPFGVERQNGCRCDARDILVRLPRHRRRRGGRGYCRRIAGRRGDVELVRYRVGPALPGRLPRWRRRQPDLVSISWGAYVQGDVELLTAMT